MSAELNRLHAYVDGSLSPAERESYEAFLKENPDEAALASDSVALLKRSA